MTLKTFFLQVKKKLTTGAEARASKKQGDEAASVLDFVSLPDILHPILGSYCLSESYSHLNKLPTELTTHEGSSTRRAPQPSLQETFLGRCVTVETLSEMPGGASKQPHISSSMTRLDPSSYPLGPAMMLGGPRDDGGNATVDQTLLNSSLKSRSG